MVVMGGNEQEIFAIGLHGALLSSFVAHILESTSVHLSRHEPVPHEHRAISVLIVNIQARHQMNLFTLRLRV